LRRAGRKEKGKQKHKTKRREMNTSKETTEQAATLGSYRAKCAAQYGEDSRVVQFFDMEIEAAPNGAEQVVPAPEEAVAEIITAIQGGAEFEAHATHAKKKPANAT
jgi:hypothetical protein